jgi:hypothetical protein
MIAPWVKEILRCPETLQELERAPSGWKRSSDGKYFPDLDGLTSLVYPLQLSGDDEKMIGVTQLALHLSFLLPIPH